MKISGGLRGIVPSLIDFIYPPVCTVCLRITGHGGAPVCGDCWNAMRRVDPAHRAWAELSRRLHSSGCVGGLLAVYLFEREGPLQECLHQLKYGGFRSLGRLLGAELGRSIRLDPLFSRAGILVPVPLHSVRMRERGYNQSEIICAGVARMTGQRVEPGVLRRLRNTPSQTSLTLRRRGENVRGAFAPRRGAEKLVRGQGVILVDDVLTTGSTLGECARTLAAAGAARVLVASVALAE